MIRKTFLQLNECCTILPNIIDKLLLFGKMASAEVNNVWPATNCKQNSAEAFLRPAYTETTMIESTSFT